MMWSSPDSDAGRCFASGRGEDQRRTNVPKQVRVTASTGNVFRDVGFRREEAEHLLVRADLMIQVQKIIADRRLKQREAGKILRVSQPRVSDLLRGRIDLFSTDALITMLARFGVRVRLTVKPTRRPLKVA
jgi:predicted XRE-type DNA-binding protein